MNRTSVDTSFRPPGDRSFGAGDTYECLRDHQARRGHPLHSAANPMEQVRAFPGGIESGGFPAAFAQANLEKLIRLGARSMPKLGLNERCCHDGQCRLCTAHLSWSKSPERRS
jgi:hypothetical protein